MRSMPSSLDAQAEAHADSSRSQPSMRSPTSWPSRLRCGRLFEADRGSPSAPRIEREAAASHPMKPLPTTTALPPSPTRSCRRVEFSTVLIVRISGSSAPGTGRRIGSEPVASTQASYDSSSPSSVIYDLALPVQPGAR